MLENQQSERAGRLVKPGHLEEVKVVTRSPWASQSAVSAYRLSGLESTCESDVGQLVFEDEALVLSARAVS
jgi:hypothetical protein